MLKKYKGVVLKTTPSALFQLSSVIRIYYAQLGVSLTQLQRYENKGVQPPADILKKLADTFNTSIDFIVYGNSEQKAQQSIKDNELLSQFKAVEQLDSKDKSTIKDIIDAFIKRSKLNQIAAL